MYIFTKKYATVFEMILKLLSIIASNSPLISRGINKRRLKRDKTE